MNLEGNRDGEIRTGGLLIEYQEIVIVHRALDGAAAGIFQTVLQHHLRLAFG